MADNDSIKKEDIEKKLKYLGLDLENIPDIFKNYESLEFRPLKTYEENHYNQYRFIDINNIQILLTPTNRLDELETKCKKARPIIDYLDSENEKNIIRYSTFLNMLKEVKISEIEKITQEQKELSKKTPYKVKFEGNYLWQIYYSQNADKYFMLVPTEDSDYSTFFYLLKKQLTSKRPGKIFVPIRNVEHSTNYLKKVQIEDLSNYLWLFTKDWPLIYDVYDKNDEMSIQIIGQTHVYEKVKSPYKIKLKNKEEAKRFYKLIKALFILQKELPNYFKFKTNIGKLVGLEFYFEDIKLEYGTLPEFINIEYDNCIEKKKIADELISQYTEKLEKLKEESASLDIEYIMKEKQISTFLECKKSFFGKVKYFFKYSGNKKKNMKSKIKPIDLLKEQAEKEEAKKEEAVKKENYTLEDLIEIYKQYELKENTMKNTLMDINALKLKNKNMKKKIENATLYIEEIDSHKKSIFDFWKYSNKDEVQALAEGEEEEVNIIKKIVKVFDYNDDFEKFGEELDKIQRKKLTKEDTDSIFITTTSQLEVLNKIKNNDVVPKDIEKSLKNIKEEAREQKFLVENEEFDIFGGISDDSTKIKKIANKSHRELPKDKFKILDVNKNSKQIGYKLALTNIIEKVKKALEKIKIQEDLPVYKAIANGKLNATDINLFNINLEEEIKNVIHQEENKINLYKINLKKGINAIGYTNCIYYDNQNKTLPIGMNLDTRILIDVSKMKLKLISKKNFKITEIENEKDDFSGTNIKYVTVFEYECRTRDGS